MKLSDIDPEILSNTAAVLATNGLDGVPQLTVIWFLVSDETIGVSINANRHKVRTLMHDPSCTLLITHPDTPNYYAEIRGTAALIADDNYAFADDLGARYDANMRNFDKPGDTRFKVEITPTKINIVDVRH